MKRSTILVTLFFILSITFFFLVVTNVKRESSSSTNGIKKTFKENVLSLFSRDKNTFDDFNSMISSLEDDPGTYSIYINDLKTGRIYTYNTNQKYYAASLFKLPIGVAILKQIEEGNLSLDTNITYYGRHATSGTGSINESPSGTVYTIGQVLTYLFKQSDNTAQTMLLEYLGVNTAKVYRVFPNGGVTEYYHTNNSSAQEIGDYISSLYKGDLLSQESKDYLFDVMQGTCFDNYISNYLDYPFAHKIGLWGGSIHDCGLVKNRDVVICVMSVDTNDERFINVGKKVAEFVNSL